MSGGGGNTTTVQRADPWAPTQPFLRDAIGDASELFDRGGFRTRPFEGDRVAGFGATSQAGQNAMIRAAQGPTASGAARSALTDMMGEGNLYRDLDAVRADALGTAIPAAVAQFSGNGMTDSSQAMSEVGRAATQAIAPIEYGAFRDQQQNQLRAAALAPGLDQAAFMPGQMLAQVGGQQDAMRQAEIDAQMTRHYEKQNMAPQALERYSSLLMGYGGQGGQSSATAPGASMGGRIAGAGLTGLGAYGALASAGVGGPMGAGLAGLLALGGLF